MNFLSVGIGAGLVSALLIAVLAKGTPLALLLFLLAPVPVLIAALGWNHRAGLVATAVGGTAIALVSGPAEGFGYVLGTALPAWWLAYLALLGRGDAAGVVEWYPTGRLLAWIAGTAALTLLAAALVSTGSYDAFQENSRQIAELFVRAQTNTPRGTPIPNVGDIPASVIIDRFANAAPIFAAQGFTLILAFYVWLGAKVVAMSGRLPRPWPPLPETLMPRMVLAILAGAVLLANLGGFVAVFGLALAGAITMAFALQGLAGLHDVTRGRSGRVAILSIAYLLLFMSQGLVLGPLFLFGIADTALGLRRRLRARPASGPPAGPTPLA
ncbi:DUF2232 domain-containing protein [Salinarimonas soli]|uniref:DUF2232 domain-containing protein n=1 Tax=Salinarimonas soli TaxID=1638099 RepID=A0A5B2VHU4_9HYPH|nr:DUF2232 domain-containing protein [Salinarimonas soli]KAA2237767.1 DUF2232 domain-containing protein [Salinarimonas soli]